MINKFGFCKNSYLDTQGRLRSPIMYLYARYLGIDAKILKGGIKPFFIKKDYNIRNLYGF